jgi:hypothetical protein
MWTAMLRRSYCVVAVGQVPSSGMAETGMVSPFPAIIFAVTSCTNSGASAGTGGLRMMQLVAFSGTGTSTMFRRAVSTAA